MRNALATHEAISDWLRGLSRTLEVLFPHPHGAVNFAFQPIQATTELSFSPYRPTVIPPGKQLTLDQEVLFTFRKKPGGGFEIMPGSDTRERVLAGVRPCDLRAMVQMDAVFSTPPADPLYLRRRQKTALIAYGCPTPCDAHCFCEATGALSQRQGADVFLTEVTGGLLAEGLSEWGEALMFDLAGQVCEAPQTLALRTEAETRRPKPFGRPFNIDPRHLGALMKKTYASPVYDRYAERCHSCTTCNLVCPTCYCFEVQDDLALDGQSGVRTRTWDGCMSPGFSAVAGGHNFRRTAGERHRHRLQRKFEFLPERHDLGSFCVGCGRCGRQCTTGIDIFDMVNDLAKASGGAP